MNRFIMLMMAFAFASLNSAYGAELVPGLYRGATGNRDGQSFGVELKILSVNGESVTGSLKSYARGNCGGDYEMAGTFDGSTLIMKSVEGTHRFAECVFGFKVIVDGNKLLGNRGGQGTGPLIELSR